jgi:hypothetical protein
MFGEGNDSFTPTARSTFAAAAEIPPTVVAILDEHGKGAALLAFPLDEDRCRVMQQ